MIADKGQMIIDLLCASCELHGRIADPSCTSCKFHHEELRMDEKTATERLYMGKTEGGYMSEATQKVRDFLTKSSSVVYPDDVLGLFKQVERENEELREQIERLITLLRNDCDIDASWDGLRRFWCIELTENEYLMRDRMCKAEAENARLRELVHETCKNTSDPPEGFLCSECGWGDFTEPSHLLTSACYTGLDKGPRYCPNCGRQVME